MKKLNLGSGGDYREGWINVESRDNVKSDVKWNLEKVPYPFKANTFDFVLLKHVLEHLSDPIGVLKEVIRISKDGARIVVRVPHATSYATDTDIQHKARFTENSFDESLIKEYELEQLVLVKKEFGLDNKWKKYIPLKKFLKIFLNGIYEEIIFEFEVKK